MDILIFIACLILAVIAQLFLMVIACSFALGRMHRWLKGKAEVFGDNEGLREELGDLRGRMIELNNAPILDRNIGTENG